MIAEAFSGGIAPVATPTFKVTGSHRQVGDYNVMVTTDPDFRTIMSLARRAPGNQLRGIFGKGHCYVWNGREATQTIMRDEIGLPNGGDFFITRDDADPFTVQKSGSSLVKDGLKVSAPGGAAIPAPIARLFKS